MPKLELKNFFCVTDNNEKILKLIKEYWKLSVLVLNVSS